MNTFLDNMLLAMLESYEAARQQVVQNAFNRGTSRLQMIDARGQDLPGRETQGFQPGALTERRKRIQHILVPDLVAKVQFLKRRRTGEL